MGSFFKNAALLALGFWLGCTVFFSAVVAPTLFNPEVTSGLSRSMAGAISGAILRRIHFITYACIGLSAFFLLLACLGEAKGAAGPRRALVLCLLILGLNTVHDRWILARMNKIKLEMSNAPTETAAATHRAQFNRWHQYSTWTFGAAMIFGTFSVFSLLPSVTGSKPKRSK